MSKYVCIYPRAGLLLLLLLQQAGRVGGSSGSGLWASVGTET